MRLTRIGKVSFEKNLLWPALGREVKLPNTT